MFTNLYSFQSTNFLDRSPISLIFLLMRIKFSYQQTLDEICYLKNNRWSISVHHWQPMSTLRAQSIEYTCSGIDHRTAMLRRLLSTKSTKGLSKNANVCRFVTTNFIATKMKIHYQPMNVKGRYWLFFDDFEYQYAYSNAILARSIRTNEGHIGVNESINYHNETNLEQTNVYFL